MGKEQNGHRRGWSCSEPFSCKILIERHSELNVEFHMAFIDIEKAFDKTNRIRFLEIMTANTMPDQIIGATHTHTTYSN